ncbi:hypothetical protein CALVIDRAFT_153284 [Calocera viscosa TUFC12733]|uniref:Uncharacterized protein n=1 Tax=Calocera viscosa (strain TUFC12733) TaxID=1330018 RepID=A0A167LLT4_CALVF|nr:hypothetical protein CALVIDRAFT_153284 [Calocera viscosa TUFC12733]
MLWKNCGAPPDSGDAVGRVTPSPRPIAIIVAIKREIGADRLSSYSQVKWRLPSFPAIDRKSIEDHHCCACGPRPNSGQRGFCGFTSALDSAADGGGCICQQSSCFRRGGRACHLQKLIRRSEHPRFPKAPRSFSRGYRRRKCLPPLSHAFSSTFASS